MNAHQKRSESRSDTDVRVLAVHTTEGTSYTAEQLLDATWWEGSAHAIADSDTLLAGAADGCVDYDRASWTLRSGNPWSENIELVAMAGWSRSEWLRQPDLLENCSQWLATRSVARDVLLRKLTPAQYRAGWRGVIGHHDHTVAYSDGTHWDPGPDFPWSNVLARAQQIVDGDDVPNPEEIVSVLLRSDGSGMKGKQPLSAVWSQTWTNSKRIAVIEKKLDTLIELFTAEPTKG